jgi:hypothetical protein
MECDQKKLEWSVYEEEGLESHSSQGLQGKSSPGELFLSLRTPLEELDKGCESLIGQEA